MSFLLLFGARGAALLASSVITISAPPVVGIADFTADAGQNTITVSAPTATGAHFIEAGVCQIVLTAPTAVAVPASVTDVVSAGTVTVSAPTAILTTVAAATNAQITLTAPTAVAVPAGVTVATGVQVISLTAPSAAISVVGGTDVYGPIIFIGGIDRSANVSREAITIRDILNHTPNTATLTVRGYTPTRGQDIKIYLGNVTSSALMFAGTIQSVDQIYEGEKPANIAFHLSCVDYTWLFDSRKATKAYTTLMSVTDIVKDICANFAPSFGTSSFVQSGLPNITEFACVEEDPSSVLSRLATLIGGYWYIDYDRDVHFFITETSDTPIALDSNNTRHSNLVKVTDISQVRNRVRVEGEGSPSLVTRLAGDTVIPVADGTKYSASGGRAKVGTERLTYTGRELGGVGTTVVGNISGPASAPTPALASGAGGVTAGVHQWKVAFGNGTGETLPGSASAPLAAIDFAAPTSAPLVSAVSGVVGPLAGVHGYKVAFVTALGETTPGPVVSRTASAVAAPGAPVTNEVSNTIGALIGAYGYKVSFLTSLGETVLGAAAAIAVSAQAEPAAPNVSTHTVAGPLIGTFKYKIGFVSALGETIGTATPNTVAVATVPDAPGVSGDGTGLKIRYKVSYVHPVFGESALSAATEDTNHGSTPVVTVVNLPAGCGWNIYSTGSYVGDGSALPYYLVGHAAVGVASFTHAGTSGPAEGIRPTLGKYIPLTSVPTGPAGTLARRVYRTKNGGATYYLVSEIADNVTSVFVDNVPDESLTTSAPLQNLNGKKIALTSIPTGTSGIVIARRIYRTEAGGSTYRLLVEIPDNSTTSYTDNIADADLGSDTAPVASTAGGQQNFLNFIPVGPGGTVARRIYRTVSGGAGEYRLVGQLSDNFTTTFTDTVADVDLGEYAPALNTAGSSTVALTGVPVGVTGVERRLIYRTKAGGSDYFLVGTIPDNVTTTFTDNVSDADLRELAPTVSTIGAQAGDTSVFLKSTSGWPSRGWFEADSQRVEYTGISGNTLTGIPAIKTVVSLTRSGSTVTATVTGHGYPTGRKVTIANATQPEYNGTFSITSTGANTFTYQLTGTPVTPATSTGTITAAPEGAIVGAIRGGLTVKTLPMLTGVPASSTGSIQYVIKDGDTISIEVEVEDTVAQAALAAILGVASGVREHVLSDATMTIDQATGRAQAELSLFKNPETQITYQTRDILTRSGKTITVNIGSPTSVVGDFKIQTVTITQIGVGRRLYPLRTVTASTTKFSLEDLLHRISA